MKLRDYLVQNGITNVAFAKRIGVSPVTVCRWLYQKHLPDRASLKLIREATNDEVSADDLYQ